LLFATAKSGFNAIAFLYDLIASLSLLIRRNALPRLLCASAKSDFNVIAHSRC